MEWFCIKQPTTMATTTNTSSHQIFQHITNMLGTEYQHYFRLALIWTDVFIYELFSNLSFNHVSKLINYNTI